MSPMRIIDRLGKSIRVFHAARRLAEKTELRLGIPNAEYRLGAMGRQFWASLA